MATFEERLKKLRKEKRINRSELAKALGVSESTVSMWEIGQRYPRKKYLHALCEFFDVSMDYLNGLSEYRDELDRMLAIQAAQDANDPIAVWESQEFEKNVYGEFGDMFRKFSVLEEPHQQAVCDMVDMYYEKDKDK